MHRTQLPNDETKTNTADPVTITVLRGPPGCGKTTAMLAEMASVPGHYLLAAPRTALVDEHVVRLRAFAGNEDDDGVRASTVTAVHSDDGRPGRVERRLREALAAVGEGDHAVVAVTHEGLLGVDPVFLTGWHVRVDELPDASVASGVVAVGASWPGLAALYDLVPSGDPGWWRVVPRPGVAQPAHRSIVADVGQGLVALHRLAGSPTRELRVDVGAWEDAGLPGRRVRWCSLWSLALLRGCASVTVAAAGYAGSLVAAAAQRAGVVVRTVDAGAPRTGQPRIAVHWYTRAPGSTAWWAGETGSAALVAISRHLESLAFSGYWTCNEAVRPYFRHRLPGPHLPPRQAGTNALRHMTACAAIYSAKATPDDAAVLEHLGLDDAAVRAAREDEDLLQFATRGAIRDGAYAGSYDIHLHDEGQAERLWARLAAAGYTDVTLRAVTEAGIVDLARPGRRCGSTPVADASANPDTVTERRARERAREAARGRRRRAAVRAKKILSGTVRRPGRPSARLS